MSEASWAQQLSLLDIAAFRAQRALGSVVLGQVTWLIDGEPDIDRVRALADRLAVSSQLGRVILPASVLGGRDHWGRLPATPVVVQASPIDAGGVLFVSVAGQVAAATGRVTGVGTAIIGIPGQHACRR